MYDDPTEHAQEEIHHHATHGDEHEGHGHGGGHHAPGWITAAALTAALLAALAAISASLATTHLTDSTLIRIQANDRWGQYQAKSIKDSLTEMGLANYAVQLAGAGGDASKLPEDVRKQHAKDLKKKAEYEMKADKEKDPEDPKGMPGLSVLAGRYEIESSSHLATHETFELSETLFHISIAVVAIAVVAKRREFWYVSMVGGLVGLWFFGTATLHAPHEAPKEAEAPVVATQKAGESIEKTAGGENHATAAPRPPRAPARSEEHAP